MNTSALACLDKPTSTAHFVRCLRAGLFMVNPKLLSVYRREYEASQRGASLLPEGLTAELLERLRAAAYAEHEAASYERAGWFVREQRVEIFRSRALMLAVGYGRLGAGGLYFEPVAVEVSA